MTIFILALSSLLLYRFNLSAKQLHYQQQHHDQLALKNAKAALLGYAFLYPEKIKQNDSHDKQAGPGHLPCPDINHDGKAVGSCSKSGGTTIGLFPHATLEQSKFQNSAHPIWYVLSERHRYGPDKNKPMNADTPKGDLNVDGKDDIVAVLIAPGPVIGNQVRSEPLTTADLIVAQHYLEGENSDGDHLFQSVGGNDKLLSITRMELMYLIKKRVLREAKLALESYQNDYKNFPMLIPFSDNTADFSTGQDIEEGYLPVADSNFKNKQGESNCDIDHLDQCRLPMWFIENNWHFLICARNMKMSDPAIPRQVCYKKSGDDGDRNDRLASDSCPETDCLPI